MLQGTPILYATKINDSGVRSSIGRASRLQRGGQRFESVRA